MKTVLYVEEAENALARAIVKRNDISLILVRFSNCTSFSEKHILETKNIPTFIIDKKANFQQECRRLKAFRDSYGGKVDVFYNDSEFNQVFIQRVARELQLPGALTEYQSAVVRDKYIMKQFIESIGMKCPEYRLLRTFSDIEQCVTDWKYPFIVKWRSGVSSIEVYTVKNENDLLALDLDLSSGKYMAEKFQTDKIWCIDAIVGQGKVLSNLYTWLPYTNLSFAEEKKRFTQLAVGFPQEYWKFDSKKMTQDIVGNLKLKDGYLHLEVFVTDEGEPVICEFAWRTPGDHMLQNFTVLYECCVEDVLIDVLIGKSVQSLTNKKKCVADVFLPLQNGRVTQISTFAELCEKCEVIDGEILYREGDLLSSEHKYTDSSGWVQLMAPSIDDIMANIDKVYNAFTLKVEEVPINE